MHENESLAQKKNKNMYFLGTSQLGLPGCGAVPGGEFAAFEVMIDAMWAGSDADSAGAPVNVLSEAQQRAGQGSGKAAGMGLFRNSSCSPQICPFWALFPRFLDLGEKKRCSLSLVSAVCSQHSSQHSS